MLFTIVSPVVSLRNKVKEVQGVGDIVREMVAPTGVDIASSSIRRRRNITKSRPARQSNPAQESTLGVTEGSQRKVFFMHLHKAAGTTLCELAISNQV